jgi:hypothetical protein
VLSARRSSSPSAAGRSAVTASAVRPVATSASFCQGSIESTYPPSTRTAAPVVAEASGELR